MMEQEWAAYSFNYSLAVKYISICDKEVNLIFLFFSIPIELYTA